MANQLRSGIKKPKTLKEALKSKLSSRELEKSIRGYDIIGDIAVIEIPGELEKKEKIVAKTVLEMHKNIKTVCKKYGVHEGEFRTRKVKVLAGQKKKETVHTESGIRMKLNVEKVYFSPRLGSERLRIARLVKDNERVLVMFSGCAPYPLIIARHSNAGEICAIEKNPDACRYAEENVNLNKYNKRIRLYCGDVKDVMPGIKEKFDRIAMPLPMTGGDYLSLALSKIKKNGIIHFYCFLPEDKTNEAGRIVREISRECKKKSRIQNIIKCGQYSPRAFRVCVDFKVLN